MATATATQATGNQALYAALNGTQSKTTTATSATDDAQNRFLKLLTTQLKNQDPLNPLDNAQMTSQLAQISTVDGIEKLNKTLQSLLGNAAESQAMQAAALVGHVVAVEGSTLTLASSVGAGGVELAGAADSVKVTIKDSNGLVVRTIDLGERDAGIVDFVWDGKTDDKAVAADGNYTFSVAAIQGTNKVTATALQFGTVAGVTRNGQSINVDLGTRGVYAMNEVKQIL